MDSGPGYRVLGMALRRAVAQQGEGSCWHPVWHHHPSTLPSPLLCIKEVYFTLWKATREIQPHLILFLLWNSWKDSSLRNWLTFLMHSAV